MATDSSVFRRVYAIRSQADAALQRSGGSGSVVPVRNRWALDIPLSSDLPVAEIDYLQCHSSYLKPPDRFFFRGLKERIGRKLLVGLTLTIGPAEKAQLERLVRKVELRAGPRSVQGGAPGTGGGRKPMRPDSDEGPRLPEGRDPEDEPFYCLEWEDEVAQDEPEVDPLDETDGPIDMIEEVRSPS